MIIKSFYVAVNIRTGIEGGGGWDVKVMSGNRGGGGVEMT